MNKEKFLELIESMNGEYAFYVETDNNSYRIFELEEGKYMCNELGNFLYDDMTELGADLYFKIEKSSEKVLSLDTE